MRLSSARAHPDKHAFEVQGMKSNGRDTGLWIATETKDVNHGYSVAQATAIELLAQYPDLEYVAIYHTYPTPGPTARFVAYVRRGGILEEASEVHPG